MRFEGEAKITQGAATADPAVPAEVDNILDSQLWLLNRRQNDSDVEGKRLLVALEGAAGETVTLDLWALDEATDINSNADTPTTPATLGARRFYRFATGLVVTSGILAEVTAAVPAGGKVYARRTADAIGGGLTRTLKATCVS